MSIKKFHQSILKIIPLKKMLPIIIIVTTLGIAGIVSTVIEDSKTETQYLELSINGNITQILNRGINVYGKVDNEWYEFYSEIEFRAKVGDTIMKDKNSQDIVIKRGSKSIRVATGDVLLVKLSKEEYYKVAD